MNFLDLPTIGDVLAGLVLGISFLILMGVAEWLHHQRSWEVEWTRKLVHVGGGLICLCFPFVLKSHWVVLVLGLTLAGLLIWTRRHGWLRSIHGVKRHSRGSEYYPAVVYLLFLLAATTPWRYVASLLVLAVADAAAALVGTRWGRFKYRVEGETKSVEGSLAFFAATVLVVLATLLIMRPAWESLDRPVLHYLLSATLIGMLVSCFEAVSGLGRDNLYIPLGTFLVLTKTFQTDVDDLLRQNISFVVLLTGVLVLAKFSRTFHTGGAIVLTCASYGCWAMGSFEWALPIFVGFALYVATTILIKLPWKLTIRPVVFNTVPPFLLMAAGNLMLAYDLPEGTRFMYGPFLVACCISLNLALFNVISWTAQEQAKLPDVQPERLDLWRRRMRLAIPTTMFSTALLVIPVAIRNQMLDGSYAPTLFHTLVICLIFGGLAAWLIPAQRPSDASWRWYLSRGSLTMSGAIVMMLLQTFSLTQVWNVAA